MCKGVESLDSFILVHYLNVIFRLWYYNFAHWKLMFEEVILNLSIVYSRAYEVIRVFLQRSSMEVSDQLTSYKQKAYKLQEVGNQLKWQNILQFKDKWIYMMSLFQGAKFGTHTPEVFIRLRSGLGRCMLNPPRDLELKGWWTVNETILREDGTRVFDWHFKVSERLERETFRRHLWNKQTNKSGSQNFLSLSFKMKLNRDAETALWKNRDCEKHAQSKVKIHLNIAKSRTTRYVSLWRQAATGLPPWHAHALIDGPQKCGFLGQIFSKISTWLKKIVP